VASEEDGGKLAIHMEAFARLSKLGREGLEQGASTLARLRNAKLAGVTFEAA
jgi:hypothetical protein